MTPAPIAGHLTKKEVSERYGRSHRSLTRDFSTAVRTGDAEVLTHLRLQTDDGTERLGTDVSLEQIQELSNKGLSPTWYVEEEWAAKRYGPKDDVIKDDLKTEAQASQSRDDQTRASGADRDLLVQRLEDQIHDLQQDKEQLYRELTIKNEQIREANERTRESNVLMKELQTLLGNVQQRALLPLPNDEKSPRWNDGIVVDESDSEPAKKSTPETVNSKRSSISRPKKSKAKGSPSKAKPTSPSKPKWNEFPTFKRLISRSDKS